MIDQDFNLYTHIQNQFKQQGDKVLLTTESGVEYLTTTIEQESSRFAQYFTNLGIQPGDRISVQVAKSPQALCLYLACLRGGFVFHPLNTGYTNSELEYFLNNAQPALVVCDPADLEVIKPLSQAANIANVFTLSGDGQGSLIDQSRNTAASFGIVPRTEDSLAALLYSSGTTGRPKGIMLSHGNLLHNAQSLIEAWGFTDQDQLLHALPIFHVHGLFVALSCALLSGASMRWLAGFNAEQCIKFLPECSVMMGVPTYYTRLLANDDFDADTVKNIRLFISGSAPLLEETFMEFERRTGHRILERYGMTETNMNTSNPLHGERKPGTVGPALPGVEVRISDEQNRPVAPGEIGNLQVRGPNVFKGYWQMPEKTAEDFTSDGFFNTGDKGQIDSDGYVSIVGRSKDMIITGGLNVYPKEIELLVDELPGVNESAIIGVPHHDFGEGVVAIVVDKPKSQLTEHNIIEGLQGKLAKYKLPKRVIFVSELPRNTMGKVQKKQLRDQFQHLLD